MAALAVSSTDLPIASAGRRRRTSLSRLDPLTGMSNRLGLLEAFGQIVRQEKRRVAVHVFDLDGFEAINDHHGHAAGDMVLMTIARRLKALARNGEIAARLGGDKLAIVQHGLVSADTSFFGDRVIMAVREEMMLLDATCTVGLRIGTAFSRLPSSDLDAKMSEADRSAHATMVSIRRRPRHL